MTDGLTSADKEPATGVPSTKLTKIENSLLAIATRYGAERAETAYLYEQFLSQAESFYRQSSLALKTPAWKLALHQVVRHLATKDLGDLTLGNYFEHWRQKERSRQLYQETTPPPTWLERNSAEDDISPLVATALENLHNRYSIASTKSDEPNPARDGLQHLYVSMRRLNETTANGIATDNELLDDLLMMLSFSAGDLPRG